MFDITSNGRIRRATMGCMVGALLMPQSAVGAQALAISSFSRSIGVYTFRHINGRQYEPGDTMHVRHVLYNVSDSTTVVRTHPYGFVVDGTLELTNVQGAGTCEPTVSRLFPGDSAWADMIGVVASSAGEYTIQLESIGLPRYDANARSPAEIRITVNAPSSSPTSLRSSRVEPMMPKVAYVVRLTGDSANVSSRDFDEIVGSAMRKFGFLPMQASEVAADAMAEIWPYLSIDLEIDERGQYQLRSSWISRVRRAIDPTLVRVAPRITCQASSNGLAARAVLFGALLVEKIREATMGYRSGRCGM